MRSTIFLLLAFYLISCALAETQYDDDEYVEEPEPVVTQAPAKPASRLGSLLSPRGRTPIGRKPSTTTTTTLKPVEQDVEEEGEDGDESADENAEQEETLTTTTEPSKKLRAGGIMRSFRTNEDLLAALKRRRAQAGTYKETTTHSSVESTTKSKASNGRNKSNSNSESSSRPGTRGRFGNSSRGKAQDQTDETQQDEVQVKNKSYHRG
ncbi:uncharacterized protein LOC103576099 [Microplitis demolitor]|uniref:uncharacterized protein LOC103576099 n=1 Tax=Microplitis demolitor TaxID=69319 RepID=UPI0004CD7E03|nr:uncharacterized protein LOC103576099 [Microplitis demolitor]